jgi:hypothetical protein
MMAAQPFVFATDANSLSNDHNTKKHTGSPQDLSANPLPEGAGDGAKLFINVCYEPSIGPPGSDVGPDGEERYRIPLSCGPLRESVDRYGSACLVVDAVFNPEALASCAKDKEFRNTVAQFAIHNLMVKHKTQFTGRVKFPAMKYKTSGGGGDGEDSVASARPLPQRIRRSAVAAKANIEEVGEDGDVMADRRVVEPEKQERERAAALEKNSDGTVSGGGRVGGSGGGSGGGGGGKKSVTFAASAGETVPATAATTGEATAAVTAAQSAALAKTSLTTPSFTVQFAVSREDYCDGLMRPVHFEGAVAPGDGDGDDDDDDGDVCEWVSIDAWHARSDLRRCAAPAAARVRASMPGVHRARELAVSCDAAAATITVASRAAAVLRQQRARRRSRGGANAAEGETADADGDDVHTFFLGVALPFPVSTCNGLRARFDCSSSELTLRVPLDRDNDAVAVAMASSTAVRDWRNEIAFTNTLMYDLI